MITEEKGRLAGLIIGRVPSIPIRTKLIIHTTLYNPLAIKVVIFCLQS